MTQLVMVSRPSDDTERRQYLIAPCDGYYSHIEFNGIAINNADEAVYSYFGVDRGRVEIMNFISDLTILKPLNLDNAVMSAIINPIADPSDAPVQVFRHFYLKRGTRKPKRIYVKAGDRMVWLLKSGGSDGNRKYFIRAKFTPETGSTYRRVIYQEDLQTVTDKDLNGYWNVNVAHVLPISLFPGAKVWGQIGIKNTHASINGIGQVRVRKIESQSPPDSDGSTVPGGDFEQIDEGVTHTLSDPNLIIDEMVECDFGNTMVFDFEGYVHDSIKEGDLLTIKHSDLTTGLTLSSDWTVNVSLHIEGNVSGESNYTTTFMDGFPFVDFTEYVEI